MIAGYPVIFGAKTHDTWGTDPDYDHIMNTAAVTTIKPPAGTTAPTRCTTLDSIDGTENVHTFDQWVNGYTQPEPVLLSRRPRATVTLTNGKKVKCNGYQYGVKITGQDGSGECLPISMTPVTPSSEPNVTQGGTSSLDERHRLHERPDRGQDVRAVALGLSRTRRSPASPGATFSPWRSLQLRVPIHCDGTDRHARRDVHVRRHHLLPRLCATS